jgi:zinc protease
MMTIAVVILSISSCKKTTEEDKFSLAYEKYTMPNGLQVVLHEDHSNPMISYTIMYHVGSSREVPGKTGFAHLFEHLLFMGSENVATGQFDKVLEDAGGTNNGGTGNDFTMYYETFPKNALEKVFWLESDRMGFFINSVTKKSLAIQQNVVQNEKRQSEDNSPYGFTDYLIFKNLYPAGHPYSWTVIGEMEDLKNATVDDAKTFYEKFYGPNNATLVLAGDFNSDSVKLLIDKYFGEVKSHGQVAVRTPMTVSLTETKKLYHKDNFANVPEITMVWPAPENYNKDMYPLDFLAKLLADGKKAPMYKVLVKEKQLTSAVYAYNSSSELAGEFTISIRANEGKTLKEVEDAVVEAFARFEKDGITEKDVNRIKAASEKSFFEQITSVDGKALQLAYYNTFKNDPGFIVKDLENIKAVTLEDILAVYDKYIKNKPHLVTSFVPRDQPELMAENSVDAGIKEENIEEATKVEIAKEENEEIVKTPSAFDRSVIPASGNEPEVNVPSVWKAELANGLKVYGIKNSELPLVNISIVSDGGASQDELSKPGVASMFAGVLPQGTRNKSPEELEEEIELLGSDIYVNAGREEVTVNSSMLAKNFDKTMALISEIILEPRWDTTEFSIALNRAKNSIIQAEAQPRSLASLTFYKLLYGKDNILGYNIRGTRESVGSIKIDDLKSYYDKNFSPSVTKVLVAGNISQEKVLASLRTLEEGWKSKGTTLKSWPAPALPEKSTIYFVDVPNSQQSVIFAGYPALSRDNPDYVKADFINYRLGYAYTSILNQILREEKGWTYGAHSSFMEMKSIAPFYAWTMVISEATSETVKIIKEEMEKYRNGVPESEVKFIKNCMLRANALKFETNNALTDMLFTMTKYGLPDDYVKKEEEVIRNMTVEEHKATAEKYIRPGQMNIVVVGDAATQMKALGKIGFGTPVLVEKK